MKPRDPENFDSQPPDNEGDFNLNDYVEWGINHGDVDGLFDDVIEGGKDVEAEGDREGADEVDKETHSLEDSEYKLGSDSEGVDDDTLYHENIDLDAEWVDNLSENDGHNQGHDDECGEVGVFESGDDYASGKDSDGQHAPVFNTVQLYDPVFELDMVFSNKHEIRMAVHSHAIKQKRNCMQNVKIVTVRRKNTCAITNQELGTSLKGKTNVSQTIFSTPTEQHLSREAFRRIVKGTDRIFNHKNLKPLEHEVVQQLGTKSRIHDDTFE
ncbi:hypothetical protein DH2020_026216 [Rehmannia glutinosa]|uniref:Uncharacterized protein n=1 Tax=Rehmannia glutinosa TaxID=99300 RepID=A0ABR0W0L2_REHGL